MQVFEEQIQCYSLIYFILFVLLNELNFAPYEDAAINCREIENQSGKIERDSQEILPGDFLNY